MAILIVHAVNNLIWNPGWRDFGKSPNLYVEVHDSKDHIFKTRIVKRNTKPTWTDSFKLTSPPLSMLTFRLLHDAPGPDVRIAEAETTVGELMEQSSPNEAVVWLDMKAPNGEILGRLSVSLYAFTGGKGIEKMSEDTSKLKLQPLVGDALDSFVAVEGLSGAKISDTLSAVLSALENIVKVGDELAKGRIAKTSILGVGQRIDELTAALLRLKDEFDRGIAVQTTVVSAQILDKVEKLENSSVLSDLKRARRSSHRPSTRRECLPGTRSEFIEHITQRLSTPSEARIVWLSGVAGSGKSTIATSVSEYFRGLGRLGIFLCFARNDMVGSDPILVLHAIAYGLATLHPHIEAAICMALSRDSNLVDAPIDKQFQELLLGPLESVKQHLIGPFIVVIDALDECDDNSRNVLGNLITNFFTKLPAAFRFFVTSRPDFNITRLFRHKAVVEECSLDKAAENDHDISVYILDRLATIRQAHRLSCIWPGEDVIQQLINLSGTLFIWAATALDFVEGKKLFEPHKRLETLLKTPFQTGGNLDQLYTLALASDGDWDDKGFRESATAILAAIALAKAPMTDSAMDAILGLDDGTAARVLNFLGSVVQWSAGQPARSLHASFDDFLVSPHRVDNPWFFDVAKAKKSLASGCFMVMQKHLKFNICRLPDSHLLNSEVSGLKETRESHLTPALTYATRFWGPHLGDSEFDDEILVSLQGFLTGKFLFWLEVLSVLQEMASAPGILQFAQKYMLGKDKWIEMFLRDAQKFVSVFAPAIAESAPHIYISAIPLAPRQSAVRAQYLSWFPRLLRYTVPESWVNLEKSLGHDSPVMSVAFSPDGKHIVSGSDDNTTVRIWDAATGAAIGEPLQGHDSAVTSVAFSPDGKHIVSGSFDQTVRIWDAAIGEAIGEPLQGHISWITSVVFSPDRQHIVSGSSDRTVRIWDAATGTAIGEPLQGHGNAVTSVAFSPDGKHIVSGSDDNTVRIWDAATGEAIREPLRGHGNAVTSVAFSPDGKHIVSGSYDNTVRIWDAATGEAIGEPLQGHDSAVTSVAFSPDSQCIVSGSSDRTVRIWDAATCAAIREPLQGHVGWVTSVAFSPDGQHIVSGSSDQTVRIWDAAIGEAIGEPLQGHISWITSVVFSPDRQHIVSGSSDRTVRIWDAATGAAIGEPLQGHDSWVTSVAFSPDGKHIVSGSHDNTVRLWDAATGEAIGEPLQGHDSAVASVGFSPDGKHIVSGSFDQTVRIWDAATGAAIGEPLQGHGNAVTSVAFSPDSQCIVSGSSDRTVRIWDAATGQAIREPLQGHGNAVTSVAFSPDGKHIVSGSDDNTVRIWDAATGAAIGEPLQGHGNAVMSVAFSPDGKHIVSGSDDNTVRIWDAATCAAIGEPLQGHVSWVTSVAFSPDGKHIVSGSDDNTVRIWDAATGAAIGEPLQGHDSWFTSVVFSPDSQHIGSGSYDQTVWDAATGGEPLQDSTTDPIPWAFHRCANTSSNPNLGLEFIATHPSWQLSRWMDFLNIIQTYVDPSDAPRQLLYALVSTRYILAGSESLDLSSFVHGTEWEKCIEQQYRNMQ
ncbi:WD40 repeat-like protein [Favolaschia claudopus]|uniref:WD40 repeat-like protein n=1 Tax=Favolaschia claudopus TaxID=2862362 RepID=A0AAW0E5Z7_9AGAR